jgi:hypothetical protein
MQLKIESKTHHGKISRPQGAASTTALQTWPYHAVATTFTAIEGEVIVLPTHTALTAALTQLHLDIFKVEGV